MRLFALLCLHFFLTGAVSTGYAQNPGDSLFKGTQIHTVNIRFYQSTYWDTLTKYYYDGQEQYLPAQVIFDGVTYDSVGVRFKGNSSFTYPNNKKPFRLAFDEFKSDQKIDGLKGLHLNNCWGDPTFLREKVHLDFCRDAGIKAPRANFARLSLNDTLWGFYSLVEHVDKTFLKTNYGNSKGDLFKAVDGFGSIGTPLLSNFVWYGTAESLYTGRYELKTDGSTTAWPSLIKLLDSLNHSSTPGTVLPAMINMQPLYKASAADNLFANLDAYINSSRNFYFYFNPTNSKAEWIVWDVSLSFGAYQEGISAVESMNVMYLFNSAERPLLANVFATDTLKKEYLRNMDTLVRLYFTKEHLYPHIDSLVNIVRPYVNEDPRKMYTLLQFENNITSDITAAGGTGTRKPGLKAFINSRRTNVLTQLSNLGISGVTELPLKASEFKMYPNYPNPFNPATTITFSIAGNNLVKVDIYSILGQKIATLHNGVLNAGTYSLKFNAGNLASGTYICRIIAGQKQLTQKMVLIK
ncbi:MAG: CotH kinase family protein [Ignavibacteria bacterium]|nr:CotH kinase family protein [Ignavibacteria bacterium]